jgi:hypothetical protein
MEHNQQEGYLHVCTKPAADALFRGLIICTPDSGEPAILHAKMHTQGHKSLHKYDTIQHTRYLDGDLMFFTE